MKFLIVCCLLICTATAALGAEADCVVDGQNLMAGDKYYPPGECVAMTCHKDGSLSGLGCPAYFNNNPKCTIIPQDNSKPYPDCCQHYKCQ